MCASVQIPQHLNYCELKLCAEMCCLNVNDLTHLHTCISSRVRGVFACHRESIDVLKIRKELMFVRFRHCIIF